MTLRLLFALVPLVTSGCFIDYRAHIESNTAWYGLFGRDTIEGVGSAVIDLDDDYAPCCTVYKDTEEGYLRVRIVAYGGGILNPGDTKWAYTNAPYGAIGICGRGHDDDDDDCCCDDD